MRIRSEYFVTLAVALLFAGCSEAGPALVEPEAAALGARGKAPSAAPATAQLLVSGLVGSVGSTIGPGGALFVAEGLAGRISRVDPRTGEVTTFASGLPTPVIPLGGPIDVAFYGSTAYALVTLVDVFGGTGIPGVYRIDGPDSHSLIADIGAFNLANPPTIEFDIDFPTGVLYAIEPYRGGFLVSDGHLNRVLHVTRDGEISVFREFGNTVPTGLEVRGNTVYMAEAGAVPHLPEDGRIVAFGPGSDGETVVAAGAPLLVDVKFGRGSTLFGLAQGIWDGAFPGSPAFPNTGSLVKVERDGTFSTVAEGLNIPTSMQFIQNTAYIVTLTGEIWTIANVAGPPFGVAR
jgi:hypothetical protein